MRIEKKNKKVHYPGAKSNTENLQKDLLKGMVYALKEYYHKGNIKLNKILNRNF